VRFFVECDDDVNLDCPVFPPLSGFTCTSSTVFIFQILTAGNNVQTVRCRVIANRICAFNQRDAGLFLMCLSVNRMIDSILCKWPPSEISGDAQIFARS
jgi:hypothetical protein